MRPQSVYVVKDSTNQDVAFFNELKPAIDLCSRRQHYVKHGVWKNQGYETNFDNYKIYRIDLNKMPCVPKRIKYTVEPEEKYKEEIERLVEEKRHILERSQSADESLTRMHKLLQDERGDFWFGTLSDEELDIICKFDAISFLSTLYEPYA